MSWPLRMVLAAELLIAVFVGQSGVLHRRAFDQAYSEWKQSPSPETQRELDRQRHLNEWFRWQITLIGFGAMAGVTGILSFAYRRNHRGSAVIPK